MLVCWRGQKEEIYMALTHSMMEVQADPRVPRIGSPVVWGGVDHPDTRHAQTNPMMARRGGFILPETPVLPGVGLHLVRVSASGIIMY